MTMRSNRFTSITKQVTSWAAIITVPTAVTGFYGQNLPYPGVAQPIGLWTSAAVIVSLSALLFILVRRSDWI
jgi:magnesium transporter